MSKPKSEGGQLVQEMKEARADRRKEAFHSHPVVQAIKGAWIFAEGASLLITSVFAIYQGHYGKFQTWNKDLLTAAGVLVLVPAAIMLSKFFRRVGKE